MDRLAGMSAREYAQALGLQLRLRRAAMDLTVEQLSAYAKIELPDLQAVEAGTGTMEQLAVVVCALGIQTELWQALAPRPRNAEQAVLIQVERARRA